jgi:hypothetical protein
MAGQGSLLAAFLVEPNPSLAPLHKALRPSNRALLAPGTAHFLQHDATLSQVLVKPRQTE